MNKGFTLIEMLVAIAIFVLGVGAVFTVAVHLYTTNSYTVQQSAAIGEARRAIEIMTKEIREARTGQDGSYMISLANDYEFIFYSDIDTDNSVERVRYFLQDSMLKRGVIDPVNDLIVYPQENEKISTVSLYIINNPPIFHYYDSQGNELPAPARLNETKMMMVYIVINVDPRKAPGDFSLESYVQLRNLKTNL